MSTTAEMIAAAVEVIAEMTGALTILIAIVYLATGRMIPIEYLSLMVTLIIASSIGAVMMICFILAGGNIREPPVIFVAVTGLISLGVSVFIVCKLVDRFVKRTPAAFVLGAMRATPARAG